ncbi:MAG TPA: OmpH family outer membrane protein [Flavobacteriales bacterium]|nr:OmpH family outer membrane protein [Flavobacteriales bacterium]
MKDKLTYINFAGFIILLTCAFFLRPENKPRYIDNFKLFNGFELKKTLEKELKVSVNARKLTLDSLRLVLGDMYRELDSSKLGQEENRKKLLLARQLENHIVLKEKSFAETDVLQAREMDEKIWKQINQYVKDYGEEKGLDIVFGTSGTGNIMYAKGDLDITDELVMYINKKYLGKR